MRVVEMVGETRTCCTTQGRIQRQKKRRLVVAKKNSDTGKVTRMKRLQLSALVVMVVIVLKHGANAFQGGSC